MTIRSKIVVAGAMLSTLLGSIPAMAVDGEVLINQAAVNAGGITPGDAAGFPALLSRPGRYKLISNLAVPGGLTGIDVTANDVTIDLNGFTIRSASPGQPGRGVNGSHLNAHRLRVLNGTITGFGSFGISNRFDVVGSDSAVIENMRIVSATGTGIFMGPRTVVRDSTIANHPGGNVSCLERCLIESSIIAGSSNGGGISMRGGMVLGNVVVGNKFFGVLADISAAGLGNNIFVGNNSGGAQVGGTATQMNPNACTPVCP